MAMMIGEAYYRAWQKRLASNLLFKRWWQFWSNYSFVFFLGAGAYLVFVSDQNIDGIYAIIGVMTASFVAARLVITQVINFFYKRQRPYQKYNLDLITSKFFSMRDIHHNSFPSRHSITYASVAGSFFALNPALGALLIVVTIMTGIARVILGYHWPTDIIGGVILGSITGYFMTILGLGVFFT